MTGPKLHPRERPVSLAQANLAVSFWEAAGDLEPELTYIELLQVLTGLQDGCLKYMLRMERHGDYDTPAGWSE